MKAKDMYKKIGIIIGIIVLSIIVLLLLSQMQFVLLTPQIKGGPLMRIKS
jgi:hypothetical protein